MFAENLKEIRKNKGLTQQELADAIFVSRTLITKYESGSVIPTKENIDKLAEALNCNTTDLLTYDEACTSILNYEKRKIIFYNIFAYTALSIVFIWSVLVWLPVFNKAIYIYPIPEGSCIPERKIVRFSLMIESLNNHSSITLISFIFSLLTMAFVISSLVISNRKINKIFKISSIILFVITLVFIIFAPSGVINRSL